MPVGLLSSSPSRVSSRAAGPSSARPSPASSDSSTSIAEILKEAAGALGVDDVEALAALEARPAGWWSGVACPQATARRPVPYDQ